MQENLLKTPNKKIMPEKTSNSKTIDNVDQSIKSTKNVGVLLIHGLTGTPTELKPLYKHLTKLGYNVVSPVLAGHGAGHGELLETTWQDWLNSVRKPLKDLMEEYDEVFIVGLSVGALLATMLAEENPKVKGLVLLSFALGIPGPNTPKSRCLLPLVFKFPFLRRYLFWTEDPPYGLQDKRLQQNITRTIQASKRGETSQYGLFRTYVDSLYQHKLLEKEVCKKAPNVKCHTFIMHSLEDTMLSIENATKIYGLLGTQEKSITFITGCDHVMTVDLKRNEVAQRVEQFISRKIYGEHKELEVKEDCLTCEIHPVLNEDELQTYPSNTSNTRPHKILIKQNEIPVTSLLAIETNCNSSELLSVFGKTIFNLASPKSRRKELEVHFLDIKNLDNSFDVKILGKTNNIILMLLNALAVGTNTCLLSIKNFNQENKTLLPIKGFYVFKESNSKSKTINLIKHRSPYIHRLISAFGKS